MIRRSTSSPSPRRTRSTSPSRSARCSRQGRLLRKTSSHKPCRREGDGGRPQQKSGRVTVVGFNYLKKPDRRAGREIVQSGESGELIAFAAFMPGTTWSTLKRRTVFEPIRTAACAHDLGSHIISLARHLVGRSTKCRRRPERCTRHARRPRGRSRSRSTTTAMSSLGSPMACSARSLRAGCRLAERCSSSSS